MAGPSVVLPFSHAKQLRCAGCFQRLTKKFDGQHDHAPYWRATLAHTAWNGGAATSAGPRGVAIILAAGARQGKRFSAITSRFPSGATPRTPAAGGRAAAAR
ncbi:hypothetical protein GCM10010423_19460 [Streptomyces levis]|uniref:Uncharacterized protein n=1 Tax=Streptomyces levis TaxID=285566 RepID=A0ABN3NL94_9ACTN